MFGRFLQKNFVLSISLSQPHPTCKFKDVFGGNN